jgi:hypothetical protein
MIAFLMAAEGTNFIFSYAVIPGMQNQAVLSVESNHFFSAPYFWTG